MGVFWFVLFFWFFSVLILFIAYRECGLVVVVWFGVMERGENR